ncbi:type III-B CRISPR module RAMP protein Cmr6 [Candidatus Electrothrix sp.]|uniref:type III-B CRISPR module RAMP protein Cmr6 n=1 Tax=Candidatus Electrothrix sp. TaxID=2170559 RepID=UPI00405616C7
MTAIKMRRQVLPELIKEGKKWDNPGLFFDKGFEEWNAEKDGERGEDIGDHIRIVCDIPVSDVYKAAYRRWLGKTADKNRFARWFGQLDGTRLFIGLGMAHVLETQVCRHPVYGMPYIPGSALKGLARAKAKQYADKGEYGMSQDIVNVLFGPDCNDPKHPETEADTGYLIFHDAWWIPKQEGGCEDKPYAPEIVTVHAVEYYKNQGEIAPHPDMESPNPNQQLAVQGSFYFVVEGAQQWAELGMKFLTLALEADGIGGKVAAGYGYFVEEEERRKEREAREKEERDKIAAEEAKKEAQRVADEKAEQEKIAAEKEAAWLSSLTPEKQLTHELNTLLDQHDNLTNKMGPAAKNIRSDLQGQLKKILKHNKWPDAEVADRQEALRSIERAVPLLDKKIRQKRLNAAKALLKTKDDE